MPAVAILTISDRSSRGERPDLSGPALIEEVIRLGWRVADYSIVADDTEKIKAYLIDWCDNHAVQMILTTGGTGFAPRDVTPEATQSVIERNAPGLAEYMRMKSFEKTPHAMLSRAVAGIRKATLIVNLPGSPKAAVENFNFISPVIPHAFQLLTEDALAEQGHLFKPGEKNG